MYAVIFRADIKNLDDNYFRIAGELRSKAIKDYGCKDFVSVSEENQELSISYWDSLSQISDWKKDPLHREAQKLGKSIWYHSYRVQILEVIRDDREPNFPPE